ncbi:MAG: hypothetical protein ABS46_06195 [Cytophagaceae bacterium SCN 52-12]|nr:MAG: hypothetical protein ABS46_06195 [Cytophagaceae bacterium SCN 52-12]
MKAKHYTLLAGLLLAAGCEKPGEEAIAPPAQKKELTPEDSRIWLEEQPSRILQDYSILWQAADAALFEGQKLITVPLYNPKGGLEIAGDAAGHDDQGKLEGAKLIFYLDEKGDIAGSLMAEQSDESAGKRSIYFFDPHQMKLQSLWKIGEQTVSGFPAAGQAGHSGNRTSGCGAADKWVNHCTDKTARDNMCWEYVGTVWTCFPDFDDNLPPTGGPGSGGPPTKGPSMGSPGILPSSGFSPYINGSFSVVLGQTKLDMLLNSVISGKVIPLVFEASVHHDIHFSREEIDYLETFSQQDIDAITDWIKAKKPVALEAIENEIAKLKKRFNDAEKSILRQYSGNSTVKYRLNVLRYGANAYSATTTTYAYFNDTRARDCGECKGNAFKHALFRIFDAVSFGREISRQLGEAHESEEDLNPTTIMDKKNNTAGLWIYDSYKNGGAGVFYWGSKVGDAMKNGDLVFLLNNRETPSNVDDPTIPGPL